MGNPNDFPDSFVGARLELQRLSVFDVRAYGAKGDGTTDDFEAIQAAIDDQQRHGGIVYLPAGIYPCSNILVPAPSLQNATKPLVIQGAGMYATTIKATFNPTFNGLIGYGRSGVTPVIAQTIIADLTLDGNSSGQGGTLAVTAGDALHSLPPPFTDISDAAQFAGIYHYFTRVRFYRATGYGTQTGSAGGALHFTSCLFDRGGQPELSAGSTHYDNIGGGDGHVVVIGCTFKDSSGNYIDYVSDNAARKIRVLFIGNESIGHQIGGVFALGERSIVLGNRLVNSAAGSGVGYDVATAAGGRLGNMVAFNVFGNMTVLNGGMTAAQGDRVFANVSADQGAVMSSIASAATITVPLGEELVEVTGTTTITSVTAGLVGQRVTLKFAGALTFTDGSNLKLNGNFVTTADDTISLICDGTNWFETSRSAN